MEYNCLYCSEIFFKAQCLHAIFYTAKKCNKVQLTAMNFVIINHSLGEDIASLGEMRKYHIDLFCIRNPKLKNWGVDGSTHTNTTSEERFHPSLIRNQKFVFVRSSSCVCIYHD